MGFLNALNQWKTTRHENQLNRMKEQRTCPDCYGRGFYSPSVNELMFYSSLNECTTCNGTGMYSDLNHRTD